MKCREMNPGNITQHVSKHDVETPSMKCREMNPGNSPTTRRYITVRKHPQ